MLFDKLFRVLVIGGAAAAAAGCATTGPKPAQASATSQPAQTKAEEETGPQQSPQSHTFRPGGARGW